MELVRLTDGKKQHWLYPFRDRIKSISIVGHMVSVDISLYTHELTFDTSNEALKALGITNISIETPVVARPCYDQDFLPATRYAYSGELFIGLTFDVRHSDNYLLTL